MLDLREAHEQVFAAPVAVEEGMPRVGAALPVSGEAGMSGVDAALPVTGEDDMPGVAVASTAVGGGRGGRAHRS